MSILSDRKIRELCTGTFPRAIYKDTNGWPSDPLKAPMIEPFVPYQVRTRDIEGQETQQKIVSYGLSSAGYDVRLDRQFKIFTNVRSTVIDPLNMKDDYYVDHEGDHCIIPPNGYILGITLETFTIPRDIVVIAIGKSTWARCFTGNTKVALVDGTTPTFEELIKRSKDGERFWGYSVNENGDVLVSELTLPRWIAKEKVIEIQLDSGEPIRCTPDHEFLLRSGKYVQAKDLKEGDSLLPLYRAYSRGYESVIQPRSYSLISTHWLSDQWNLRHGVYEAMENCHRHHKDENKRNNNPWNIVRVNASEHIREHNLERLKDPEWIESFRQSLKTAHAENSKDPVWFEAFKERCRHAARCFYHDDVHHEARQKWLAGARARGATMSQEERARRADQMREFSLRPEIREASSRRLLALWENEEFRKAKMLQTAELNVRKDVTEEALRNALEKHGSIRGAARELNCDRTTFRRFRSVVAEYKNKWDLAKVTIADMAKAFEVTRSIRGAARLLGIDHNYFRKRKDLVSQLLGTPVGENHSVVSIQELPDEEDVYCLTAPEFGNFALASGVFVKNCGAIVNVTPIEPGWEGRVVIEIANACNVPIKIHAGMGIAQFMFYKLETPCEVSYADRGGKYQGQQGLTTAKV